ncbi:hypothetical protein CU097_007165 [Rhizopus azygosporus]|uniref:Uncharacterized protein n=1 Tax=Rhizopus azygosporus TaxID=86630 RepID=A0A367J662_RHIAZ|nr:hypothetical protein CU097_007165 [Rhizopus azygosporus]
MSIEQLRDKLLNRFVRYGIVRELAIYLDDWAQRWFSGNGCIYLERSPSSKIKFDHLTYKIPLDGDHSCLGRIVLHFRLKRILASYTIAVVTSLTASKRRRSIPVNSSYEAPVTVLSRPVETLSSTAPPTSSVPVLHEIPATSEEVASAPASKHQTAVPMPSADSSVELAFVPTPVQENVATQPILDHTTSTEILSDVTMDDSDNESMVSSTPSIKKSAAKIAKNKTSINPIHKSSRLNKGQTGEKFHDSKRSTLGISTAASTLLGHGVENDNDTVGSSTSH